MGLTNAVGPTSIEGSFFSFINKHEYNNLYPQPPPSSSAIRILTSISKNLWMNGREILWGAGIGIKYSESDFTEDYRYDETFPLATIMLIN